MNDLSFPIAVDALVRTRLWIVEEFLFDVNAETALAVLGVHAARGGELDSKNLSVFETATTAPFDGLEDELLRGFLEFWLGTAFETNFVMSSKNGGESHGDVEELGRNGLKITVVEDVDTCIGESFSYVRVVVKDRDPNSGDSHIATEKLGKHGFHVGKSVFVWDNRVATQNDMTGGEPTVNQFLQSVHGLGIRQNMWLVHSAAVSRDTCMKNEMVFVAEHSVLKCLSRKAFGEDDGSVNCGEFLFP